NKKTDKKTVTNGNTLEKAVADNDKLEDIAADCATLGTVAQNNDTPDDIVADIKKTDANKLLIYTANITRDFVVDGNTSKYNQQVTNARRKYSDIISIHKGEKIFVDDRREVYRKLNRSRLIDLYNSGVFSGDLEYRRMVDENVFHYVFTEFWLYKDDFTGDIMALFNIADIHTEYLNKVELMHNAEFDGLTGVYNRISAEQKIKAYLENKGNAELDVAFMIFDLDYFKSINDDFGHLAGDKALRDVAQTAYESFDDNSLVARVGGDEFAIFVFDINDRQKVRDCVGKFVSDVSKISMDKDAKKSISISLGLCFSKVADCEYGVLYERADDALMVAKRTGRNRFYEFGSTDFDDGIDK
ncbi:MAG: GGDEF domain-containing protein, partial [Clostridia bacterium]